MNPFDAAVLKRLQATGTTPWDDVPALFTEIDDEGFHSIEAATDRLEALGWVHNDRLDGVSVLVVEPHMVVTFSQVVGVDYSPDAVPIHFNGEPQSTYSLTAEIVVTLPDGQELVIASNFDGDPEWRFTVPDGCTVEVK